MKQSYVIRRSCLRGELQVPSSKSHSLRALLFASLADGDSLLSGVLDSPDTQAMINACRQMGAKIHATSQGWQVSGVHGLPCCPQEVIDAGNSGQVLRFVGAISSLIDGYTVISGDHSIRHQRNVAPLLSGLQQLGCFAISTKQDGFAPIVVKGPITGNSLEIDGQDSQPVSALLMAAAFAKHPIEINVTNPGETPWVGLTLSWLDRLGIRYQVSPKWDRYQLFGQANYSGFNYQVPGDFSSAAFPVVAALITGGQVKISNLDMQDCQGDKKLMEVLHALKMPLTFEQGAIEVGGDVRIPGFDLDINGYIDALPILTVLACFADGECHLRGAKVARTKESDRLRSMTQELGKMGADITEHAEGLSIRPRPLQGARVHSHHDHRVAMALAVAGMGATGITHIDDVACVDKSYPGFADAMQRLGAKLCIAC